jgi:nucleoside-diphosphate-sugar epimerase
VTEEHPLVPMTLYNKFKGLCEPILWRHMDDDFTCVNIRPATICGYSPGQRLDLAVNILTNHAVNSDRIPVMGGAQKRPNLHIADMCNAYWMLLEAPHEKIHGETFNLGADNRTIMELALMVQEEVEKTFGKKVPVEVIPTSDNRSYWINSDKIKKVLGFYPQYTVREAIHDLCEAFRAGLLPNPLTDTRYSNVKRLIELGVK